MRSIPCMVLSLFVSGSSFAGVINQVGTYDGWGDSWTSLGGYDADALDKDAAPALDFVGNEASPGLYTADNGEYVMFRMRVDADTFTAASGAHLVLIDVANYGVTGIDYAFAWDSKSADITKHGLEMCIKAVNGPTWGVSQVDDLDGLPSTKAVNDINGFENSVQRTTDGYVRSTDGQSTVAFGNTTLIDFAVSWSYLTTYTDLRPTQSWSVGLASIANATDHNVFNADVSGASFTDSIAVGWSAPMAVPEPGSAFLFGAVSVMGMWVRRRFRSFTAMPHSEADDDCPEMDDPS